MASNQLFLIDGHALCYRSFFAIRELSTSGGQPVNAVLGFLNTLKKILREYQPGYMAVCFDSREKTKRQERFADYKIQRPSMPEDLRPQIPIIKEMVAAYNLAVFEFGGAEADDIIATLADRFSGKDLEVVIVSDDKDMYQLAGKKVKFFSPRKGMLFGQEEIKNNLGFEPGRIVDFIALAGDKTDNIPGVQGIGAVTAKKLINKYGGLLDILGNIEQVEPEKVKEKICEHREVALLSLELAILDRQVPLDADLAKIEVKPPDEAQLFELFKRLEFRKFADELAGSVSLRKNEPEILVNQIADEKDGQALVNKIREKGRFIFMVDGAEAEGAMYCSGLFVFTETAGEEVEVYRINADRMNIFKEVMEDEKILKVTHDLKVAFRFLSLHSLSIKGNTFDVMLAGYLLNPAQSSFDLDSLAWSYFKEACGHDSVRAGSVLLRLFTLMRKELEEKSLLKLFEDVEVPLAYVLYRMEARGVKIDIDFLKGLSEECDKKIKELTSELYEAAGVAFNLNSPKQLSRILFGKLGLPVIKKTKTGFSTNEEVLTILSRNHDFPAWIIKYRQLSKLKSTYVDALPKLVNKYSGRIHAKFNQTVTETGRLSSSQPNLQNIPIRTELGRRVRKAIIPSRKDMLIVSADYSQIELRVLAHLSGDRGLAEAFKSDGDIHTHTASQIFDVTEKDVTKQMRYSAKRVNFGIVYGMSAFGLSKDLGISPVEAQDFIDRYFLRYPDVRGFMDRQISKCEQDGFVVTLLNRRRYLPEIKSSNASVRQFAQRQAVNTPVQGTAADLMKLAMVNMQRELERGQFDSAMLITVHDELVFDVPLNEKEGLISLVRDTMEHAIELSVPVKVTVKAGHDWLDIVEEPRPEFG